MKDTDGKAVVSFYRCNQVTEHMGRAPPACLGDIKEGTPLAQFSEIIKVSPDWPMALGMAVVIPLEGENLKTADGAYRVTLRGWHHGSEATFPATTLKRETPQEDLVRPGSDVCGALLSLHLVSRQIAIAAYLQRGSRLNVPTTLAGRVMEVYKMHESALGGAQRHGNQLTDIRGSELTFAVEPSTAPRATPCAAPGRATLGRCGDVTAGT